MRVGSIVIALVFPVSVAAMPFIDSTYATGTVPIESGFSGGRSSQQYRSVSSVIEEDPTTGSVPVRHYADPAPSSAAQSSSFSQFSSEPIPVPVILAPLKSIKTQEELDELTLEELEEYANEAAQNLEEQLKVLHDGFSVTGTSTLGSPLPAGQRSAILRRSVRTAGQLKLFAKALTESNENLRKITVDDESITMTYRSKAYLFGFIPFHYLTTVTATFGGEIVVDAPWWLSLARDNVAQVEDALGQIPLEDGEPNAIFQIVASFLQSVNDTLLSNS